MAIGTSWAEGSWTDTSWLGGTWADRQAEVVAALVQTLTALVATPAPITLASLRHDVLTRLGDLTEQIWTAAEVDLHLREGYHAGIAPLGVFYDWLYLENLPRGFSYTQPWEQAFLAEVGGFDLGRANFTAEFERGLLGDERLRSGPANYTSPFEATDGWLSSVGASTDIPATADLPTTLLGLVRVSWDRRGIDAMEPRRLARSDARYELTKGEVFGYLWRKDGLRTLRKVRVPSAQADTAAITGSWGVMRQVGAFSADTVTGTWGAPRRISGQHPMGADYVGVPRRPYLEGKNVRVEHVRQGRPLVHDEDVCELPPRYAVYLRDYAQAQCLGRRGPGQDVALAAHFLERWQRGLARITRRLQVVDTEHVGVLGGIAAGLTHRPPRPSRPWPYGSVVR